MKETVMTNENFKEFVSSNELVLVDFWATWCGPCRMLAPIVEKLAEEDFIKVGKLDVDDCGEIAQIYQVNSIPTLILFKDGKVVDKKVGFLPEVALKNWINQVRK